MRLREGEAVHGPSRGHPGPPPQLSSSLGQSPRWFHSQVVWGLLFLALSPEWGA